jgi:hypothetical protein
MNGASLFPFVFTNCTDTDRINRFDGTSKQACKEAKIGVWQFSYFRGSAVVNRKTAGILVTNVMNVSGRKTKPVFDRHAIVDDKD